MRLLIPLVFFVSIAGSYAQTVRLNEIFYADRVFFSNDYPLIEASIELYNLADTTVSLSAFYLSIKDVDTVFQLEDYALPRFRHHVIRMTNFPFYVGQTLELRRNEDGAIIDEVQFVVLGDDQSYGRVPSGSGQWRLLQGHTLEKSNEPNYVFELHEQRDWYKFAAHAGFGYRDGAGSVVFNDEMWLLGGWAHGPLMSDVWKSPNGVDWEFVANAPWPGRHQAGCVVFKNRIWVISGDMFSDVWSSPDGAHWDLEVGNAPWGERYAPYVVVYDDNVWLMGGQTWEKKPDGTYDYDFPISFNDVWRSADGRNWELVSSNAAWAPRSMVGGSVVFDGKMWILGGGVKGNSHTVTEFNDVWSSEDGANWTLVSDNAPWEPRIHLSTIVYNNKIWITDGSPGSPSTLTNEVWNSSDGIQWNAVETQNIWTPRHATSLFNFQGSLWVVAGFNGNDVWRFEDTPPTYFSKSEGDLSLTQTWGELPDGGGSSPRTFHQDNQIFILTNRDSVVLDDELNIGRDSKLIVGSGEKISLYIRSSITASIDVNSNASLYIESAEGIQLDKLYPDSEVFYVGNAISEIIPAAYFNLTLCEPREYNTYANVDVLGTLHTNNSTVLTGQSLMKAYGDVVCINSKGFENANLWLTGSADQKITAGDSVYFRNLVLNKDGGVVGLDMGMVFVSSLTLSGGNLQTHDDIFLSEPISFWDGRSILALKDNSHIKLTALPGEIYSFPTGLDSVLLPIILRSDTVTEVAIAITKTHQVSSHESSELNREFKLGWEVTSNSGLDLALMWNEYAEPREFHHENPQVQLLQKGDDNAIIALADISVGVGEFQGLHSHLANELNLRFANLRLNEPVNGIIVVKDSKIGQYISMDLVDSIFYKDAIRLNAQSSTGKPVQFYVSNESNAAIDGDSLIITGLGEVALKAHVSGDEEFLSAELVFVREVNKAKQSIAFPEIPTLPLSRQAYKIEASASSGLPVTFSVSNSRLADVEGDQLTLRGAGSLTIEASQPGNEFYQSTKSFRRLVIEEPGNVAGFDIIVDVFPNPSTGRFNLQLSDWPFKDVRMSVKNMLGQEVYQRVLTYGEFNAEIDLSYLGPGYFLLEISGSRFKGVKRLVISE